MSDKKLCESVSEKQDEKSNWSSISGSMDMEEDKNKTNTKPFFSNNSDGHQFNMLHPDDPLMQKFQDALKAHLMRMDNKLSEEIREIKHVLKNVQKEREDGGSKMRNLELEILNQRKAIENYQNLFSDVIASREHYQEALEKVEEEHKKKLEDLKETQINHFNLKKMMEQLTLEEKWYLTLENEISSEVSISKRISDKDIQMQRELLREKKQRDYIMYKLDEEIWKIQSEMRHLQTQLEFKEEDKNVIGQAISDVNAELEALQKELKELLKNCNLVLLYIKQRDEINMGQNDKRREMRNSLKVLQLESENIKKECDNEMINNCQLTELKLNIDKEVNSITKNCESQKIKIIELEDELEKLSKITELCEKNDKNASSNLQDIKNQECELDKNLEKLEKKKTNLEDQILDKLNETIIQDKTIYSLNKQLQETKQKNKEYEFLTAQAESTYSKNLLIIQQILSSIEDHKFNLDEFIQINIEKEKRLEKTKNEVKKCETNISVKEAKLLNLKKKIDEILQSTKGQDVNLLELKISTLEKSLEETETKNQQVQKFWLRQQRNLINLREQRNTQLQELSLFTKQTMIIEQKNYKLEYELDKQKKENHNVNKKINELQQLMAQRNSCLAARRELKLQLEDINYVTRSEHVISLEDAEKELMMMQIELKELKNRKEMLKSTLYDFQLESFSWEKKVQWACEASKIFKEERKKGGDIAVMKSEIHKMEMRLSHLKKFQQKLIQDMEFCISRRENILERVNAEEKRNPKNEHNRRIIIQKRLDDQKLKIKQMNKEMKQIEDEIRKLENDQKQLQEKMNDAQKILRENEETISNIDKEIMEAEMRKNHNLEILIRKQRKAFLLQKIKNGDYKMCYKSELSLDEELQRQRTIKEDLKEILSQTKIDFPLLKNEIRKILLSLDI